MPPPVPAAGTRSPSARALDLVLPIGLIAAILVIMVPLPPALLDVLLAINISTAVIMLLGYAWFMSTRRGFADVL